MAERREIRLYDDDLIAAAQILAWIALPHRPEHGVSLIEQWFWSRRKYRGDFVPVLPYTLKKPRRIESQLICFRESILRGFRAGTWFDWKSMSALNHTPMLAGVNFSTRDLANMRARTRGTYSANEIRDVWSRRRPVAHLASATLQIISIKHDDDDEGFDLERAVFNPNWVAEAILSAENKARFAERLGWRDTAQFYRFHRDTF